MAVTPKATIGAIGAIGKRPARSRLGLPASPARESHCLATYRRAGEASTARRGPTRLGDTAAPAVQRRLSLDLTGLLRLLCLDTAERLQNNRVPLERAACQCPEKTCG